MANPRAEMLLNMPYLNLITFNELFHFALTEEHELFMLHHLGKVLLREKLCCLHQVHAVMRLCKVSDAKTVGWV